MRSAFLVALCLLATLCCSAKPSQKHTRPVYVGAECHPDALDPAGCPLAGACGFGVSDRCVLWKRGLFVYPPDWSEPALPSPRCAAASDADGSFQGERWTLDDASCALARFDA